jgi:hypothetical protein
MLASLALFCSALLYVRWRYQLNRAGWRGRQPEAIIAASLKCSSCGAGLPAMHHLGLND